MIGASAQSVRPSEELMKIIHEKCGGIGHAGVYLALADAAILHARKNKGYRSVSDPLANFRNASPVRKGNMNMVQYAFTLCSKQDDALDALLWPKDLRDFQERGGYAMLRERLMDGLVYRAIMLAMLCEEESCHVSSRMTEEKTPAS